MFHGPKGTLEPIPDRISQDMNPRTIERPGIRAQKTRPLTIQPIDAEDRDDDDLLERQPLERSQDLLVIDVPRQDDDEDEERTPTISPDRMNAARRLGGAACEAGSVPGSVSGSLVDGGGISDVTGR